MTSDGHTRVACLLLTVVTLLTCAITLSIAGRVASRKTSKPTHVDSSDDETCVDLISHSVYDVLTSLKDQFESRTHLHERLGSDSNLASFRGNETFADNCEKECIDISRDELIDVLDKQKGFMKTFMRELDNLIGQMQKCLRKDQMCCFVHLDNGSIAYLDGLKKMMRTEWGGMH